MHACGARVLISGEVLWSGMVNKIFIPIPLYHEELQRLCVLTGREKKKAFFFLR